MPPLVCLLEIVLAHSINWLICNHEFVETLLAIHWSMVGRMQVRHVLGTGFWNGPSSLKQYFVLPKNGSKYYLKYTFLVFPVLGILGLGTSLMQVVLRQREEHRYTHAPSATNEGDPFDLLHLNDTPSQWLGWLHRGFRSFAPS